MQTAYIWTWLRIEREKIASHEGTFNFYFIRTFADPDPLLKQKKMCPYIVGNWDVNSGSK